MDQFLTTDALLALITLTGMEIVLGIDNIVFISIVVGKLPKTKQERTRKIGISAALVLRLGLLFAITWIMGLTKPWFTLLGTEFSGRALILLLGGLFLIAKATREMHVKIEGAQDDPLNPKSGADSATMAIVQILLLDIVFSLDSVITAVGMADNIPIMMAAMVIAMLVMLFSAKWVGNFVENNPTIKILALAFMLLIGVLLVAEGLGAHISKGYIYFAMAFSLGVEILNMRYRRKHKKVRRP